MKDFKIQQEVKTDVIGYDKSEEHSGMLIKLKLRIYMLQSPVLGFDYKEVCF